MITPSFGLTATERVLPKLALDFTTASLDSRITFTRALNTATRVNSSGNIEVVNADVARFDYDPTTLQCKGLLIEESRVNSLRNNTMQNSAAGTPGTYPTNWSRFTPLSGLTSSIEAVGVENGIEYIDVKLSGTPSGNGSFQVFFETGTSVAALTGEAWSLSSYLKIVGGSSSNVTFRIGWDENNGSGGFVTNKVSPNLSITSALARLSHSATLTGGATVAYIFPWFAFNVTSGQAVDVTVRIGLPQAEKGAFPTSVIKTSTATVTRNADVATMTGTNFSSWYNQTENAVSVQFTTNASAGALPFVAQVDNGTFNGTDRWAVYRESNNQLVLWRTINNVASSISSGITVTSGTSAKATAAVKNGNNGIAVNGNATATDAAGIPAGTMTTLRIGARGSDYFLNGVIAKLAFYPQRLINTEIQAFSK